MSVDINNESGESVDEARVLKLAEYALDQMKIHPDADLAIVFVDEPAIEKLHIEWMDEPGPTDVLSFPMDELRPGTDFDITPAGLLGDIVICPQVAEKQAHTAGHSTMNEILLLTTHGILHLLGFDHAEPEEHTQMFGIQAKILEGFYAAEAQG